MRTNLERPTPADQEARNAQRAAELRRRIAGVDIDRHIERSGTFADRPEPLVVEIFAVGVRIDDSALEPERPYGALQFLGGRVRVLGRQGSEACQAIGILS